MAAACSSSPYWKAALFSVWFRERAALHPGRQSYSQTLPFLRSHIPCLSPPASTVVTVSEFVSQFFPWALFLFIISLSRFIKQYSAVHYLFSGFVPRLITCNCFSSHCLVGLCPSLNAILIEFLFLISLLLSYCCLSLITGIVYCFLLAHKGSL